MKTFLIFAVFVAIVAVVGAGAPLSFSDPSLRFLTPEAFYAAPVQRNLVYSAPVRGHVHQRSYRPFASHAHVVSRSYAAPTRISSVYSVPSRRISSGYGVPSRINTGYGVPSRISPAYGVPVRGGY